MCCGRSQEIVGVQQVHCITAKEIEFVLKRNFQRNFWGEAFGFRATAQPEGAWLLRVLRCMELRQRKKVHASAYLAVYWLLGANLLYCVSRVGGHERGSWGSSPVGLYSMINDHALP